MAIVVEYQIASGEISLNLLNSANGHAISHYYYYYYIS